MSQFISAYSEHGHHKKFDRQPSEVRLTYSSPDDPWHKRMLIESVELLSGRPTLEREYQEIIANPPENIWKAMVARLKLNLVYDQKQLAKVPQAGPVIYIANHPYGVVDGIVMGYLVSLVRKEFKFLVNEVLCKEELLNRYFLPVDFNETREAQRTNIETRKFALDCIESGKPVVIFPSGGVATAPKFWMKAEELEWKRFVVKLIQKSRATVIPIYFYGQNSRLFQLVSQFSTELRLGLLLNEVRNKVGKDICFEIGDPIGFDIVADMGKSDMLTFLSDKVHSLKRGS